jgi:hypothetical protein
MLIKHTYRESSDVQGFSWSHHTPNAAHVVLVVQMAFAAENIVRRCLFGLVRRRGISVQHVAMWAIGTITGKTMQSILWTLNKHAI